MATAEPVRPAVAAAGPSIGIVAVAASSAVSSGNTITVGVRRARGQRWHKPAGRLRIARCRRHRPRLVHPRCDPPSLSLITPTVAATDCGGVYNRQVYAVTAATVTAGAATLTANPADPRLGYPYYAGTITTSTGLAAATPLGGAPVTAGAYTVVAHFTSTDPSTPAAASPVNFIVTPAPLVIIVAAASKVYAEPVPTLTGTVSGVISSDSVTVSYATTANQFSSSIKAGYPITVSGLTGSQAVDYSLTVAGASVTPGVLTVSAMPLSQPDPLPGTDRTAGRELLSADINVSVEKHLGEFV